MLHHKICPICQKPFDTIYESQIYHSLTCQNTAQRRRQRARKRDKKSSSQVTIEVTDTLTGDIYTIVDTESNRKDLAQLDSTRFNLKLSSEVKTTIDGAQLINAAQTNETD